MSRYSDALIKRIFALEVFDRKDDEPTVRTSWTTGADGYEYYAVEDGTAITMLYSKESGVWFQCEHMDPQDGVYTVDCIPLQRCLLDPKGIGLLAAYRLIGRKVNND